MEKVKQWLAGKRNFIIGRAIYKALGYDQELIRLLDKGPSTYCMQQLVLGMQDLLKEKGADPVIKTVIPVKKRLNIVQDGKYMGAINENGFMPDGSDHVLQAIKMEWLPLYKKMQYNIAQLDKYGDRNDQEAIDYRKPIAADILELEQQINKIWQKRDHYLEHGNLPADKKIVVEVPKNPLELATLISRITRNIRTNRQQMKLHPDKANFAKKYLDYKTQYQQITGKQYQEVDNE